MVVSYWRQRMGPLQVRIDPKTATMADPTVALTYLHPDPLACVVARAYVTARRADETTCLLVAVLAPVHLRAASQTANRFIERIRPLFPGRGAEFELGIVDGPLRDSAFATSPGIIRPRVHDHQRRPPRRLGSHVQQPPLTSTALAARTQAVDYCHELAVLHCWQSRKIGGGSPGTRPQTQATPVSLADTGVVR